MLVFAELNLAKPSENFYYNRDWSKYSPDLLKDILRSTNLTFENDTVQEFWNTFENVLVNIVDKIAPMKRYSNFTIKTNNPPTLIKSKINRRKFLLQKTVILSTS